MTNLYSKTRWRNQGRGIKDGQDPVKTVLCHGRHVDLYSIEQTTTQKPYTIARNDLLNLFANWPDRFGYETPKGEIYQVQVTDLRGGSLPLS